MATIPAGFERTEHKASGRSRRRIFLQALAAVSLGAGAAWWYFGQGEPVAATGAVSAAVTQSPDAKTTIEGSQAIARCRELLQAAQRKLVGVKTMSAVFQKQERIDDKLQPLNVMDLKVRNEPLSVYMKWQMPETGQQIIWRNGEHDGKILVSTVGWKKKVMPLAKLDPEGDMAMAFSRRPVSNAGIWTFTDRVLSLVDEELTRDPAVQVQMSEGHEISGRPCYRFSFEHPRPSPIVPFKNVTIFYDRVLEVPVACEHHRYVVDGKQGDSHLEESYLFRDLTLGVSLSDADFDHQNPSLQFGVK